MAVRPIDNNQDQTNSEEDGQDQGCFGGIFKRTSRKRNEVANTRQGCSLLTNIPRFLFYLQQNILTQKRRPQEHMKQLEDDCQDTSKDDSFPTEWPLQKDLEETVKVKMCGRDSLVCKKYWDCKMTYAMKRRTRGKALIINNQHFSARSLSGHDNSVYLPDRVGSEKDRDRLSQLFEQLHFFVETHNDLTAEELLHVLATESKNRDHDKANCFILIILSHGSEHGIYGVDGDSLSLEENIKPFFKADQCPFLAGKPKLFFIQACQGGAYDTGVSIPYEEDSFINEAQTTESITATHLPSTDATVCHPARQIRKVPTLADMFVASSSTKGFVSFRHENLGSWFIQTIVYVFQRYAHEKDIGQLLVMVQNLVGKARGLNESTQAECMQAASTSSTLTKNFFFFPGVFEADMLDGEL